MKILRPLRLRLRDLSLFLRFPGPPALRRFILSRTISSLGSQVGLPLHNRGRQILILT
jgi:hypothetical protein